MSSLGHIHEIAPPVAHLSFHNCNPPDKTIRSSQESLAMARVSLASDCLCALADCRQIMEGVQLTKDKL